DPFSAAETRWPPARPAARLLLWTDPFRPPGVRARGGASARLGAFAGDLLRARLPRDGGDPDGAPLHPWRRVKYGNFTGNRRPPALPSRDQPISEPKKADVA